MLCQPLLTGLLLRRVGSVLVVSYISISNALILTYLADANVQMVGRHVARATAKQAIDAQYSEARKSAIAAHKLMERVRLAYHRFTVHNQQPSGRY